ncbi:MAG: DUF814 domain-containing protein [candidate division WOR-3 bacterium]|nr:MAG: DUF814 domain-containing protein [candidate division WOR-3 bacterium]
MNGIYLHLLLAEIRKDLIGTFVRDVRMKDRLIILLLRGHSLHISLYPTVMGMFLDTKSDCGFDTMKAISDTVRSCRITEVVQECFMPVVRMQLEKSFPGKEILELIVSFYPEAPNFSLRTESWQRNAFPRYVEKKPKSSIFDLSEAQIAGADVDYLIRNIEGIDKKLAQEIDAEILRRVKSALRGARVRPKLVSGDPLNISLSSNEDARSYPSFNRLFKAAITRFEEERERKRSEQDKRLLVKNMKRRIARLRKKILQPAHIEGLRTAGDLLLSNVTRIKKGSSTVSFLDPYLKRQRQIIIDPRLTPQANAQKYFAKYKKEKRGQPKLREQIAKLEKEIVVLKSGAGSGVAREKIDSKTGPVHEPFHKFTLNSGSIVYVGKNARSNEQLTFTRARPADYFFHARGVEGAHVILRANVPRGQRPGKDEIRTAGAIAAHFSKARKQRNVPVSYTQRKYLKKSKRAKVGSVTMMREEVVFVDPGLPE